MKEEDVLKFLAAGTHLGGTNLDFQMDRYIYKRKSDGIYIIKPRMTWEKLLLTARAIVAIESSADVSVMSFRNTGERAMLKFAAGTGATAIAGRFTPGTFTNQIQAVFQEPRLLVAADPRADHQPLTEASCVNLTTIAPCNTDSPPCYVDTAIPCNKGAHPVGLMWCMLAQEVIHMRGTISREHPWEVMPDLYFYRDPEEMETEEQAAAEKAVTKWELQSECTAPAPEVTAEQPLSGLKFFSKFLNKMEISAFGCLEGGLEPRAQPQAQRFPLGPGGQAAAGAGGAGRRPGDARRTPPPVQPPAPSPQPRRERPDVARLRGGPRLHVLSAE
ncbi:LOW QUALITY PROTEIN: 40S ribosomal protein SA-like [Lemur catta]|uniref:LOW QUALITY PROTEIN: 40S ribosomal protein SA-like n=1 Tax=Lemur catta TaxID=9447 RepID=UPI001E269BF1|nr:LOW QUALITY PROTEIN: 40S ribosomal protein SA-like [Lemur catta]